MEGHRVGQRKTERDRDSNFLSESRPKRLPHPGAKTPSVIPLCVASAPLPDRAVAG